MARKHTEGPFGGPDIVVPDGSTTRYGPLFTSLARDYQYFMERSMASYGVPPTHVPLLAYLYENESHDTQNAIARNLGVDKGTVSRNVRSLVNAGLATQACSVRDTRACEVSLTAAGRYLAEIAYRNARRWNEAVCSGVSQDSLSQLGRELSAMCERSAMLVSALSPGEVPDDVAAVSPVDDPATGSVSVPA